SNHVDFTFPIFDDTKLPITTISCYSVSAIIILKTNAGKSSLPQPAHTAINHNFSRHLKAIY
ncbi:hypothetical protein, partial [Bacteroides bouchesdurhonensis]|uniref:hypothetical protein n=1 Tax=Bacteroides bouchesdurhonensis TaxID=1841855 RepID=UPI0022E25EBB